MNIGGNPYSSGQLNQFRTQNTMKESYTNDGAFVQGFAGASTGQGMYDDPKVDVLSDSQRRNQLAAAMGQSYGVGEHSISGRQASGTGSLMSPDGYTSLSKDP